MRYIPALEIEALKHLDIPLPPMLHLVSSMVVDSRSGHDHVRLWSRGALVGELTVARGDGAELAVRLGLVLDDASMLEVIERFEHRNAAELDRGVKTAIGAQLDVLGRSVGVVRHGRDDESYRREILSRCEREKAADPKVGGDV